MSSASENAAFEYGIVGWDCLRRVSDFERQQTPARGFGFINGGEEAPLIVGCITVDPDLLASMRHRFCCLSFIDFVDSLSGIVSIEMFYSLINE